MHYNPLKAVFEILSTDWEIATCSIERGFFPVFTLAALAFCETPLILLASYELVLLLSRGIRGRQGDQRSFLMKFNEYLRWGSWCWCLDSWRVADIGWISRISG